MENFNIAQIFKKIQKEIYQNNLTQTDILKLKRRYQKIRSVGIHTNNRCNLNCRHCFYASKSNNVGELSLSDWYVILDQFIEIGVKHYHFCGREPFLDNKIVSLAMYLKGKSKDFSISAMTNGILIDKFFSDFQGTEAFSWIDFSIDGLENSHNSLRGHGNYTKTIKNVEFAMKNKFARRIQVSSVASKLNNNEIIDMIDFLSSIGIADIFIQPLEPVGKGKNLKNLTLKAEDYNKIVEDIASYLKRSKNNMSIKMLIYPTHLPHLLEINERVKRSFNLMLNDEDDVADISLQFRFHMFCVAYWTYCKVTSDGFILGCDMLLTKGDYRDYSPGNAKTESIQNILKNAIANDSWHSEILSNSDKILCSKMDCIKTCNGGCRFQAFFSNESYEGIDPLCEYL